MEKRLKFDFVADAREAGTFEVCLYLFSLMLNTESVFLNLWLWISGKPCSVAGEPVGDQSAACGPVRTGGGDRGGTETIHGLDTSSPGHHCAAGSTAAGHSRCAGICSVVQQHPISNKPKQSMLILLHQRPY